MGFRQNLVAYYRQNSGNDAFGTHHGTIYGAADVAGKIGRALNFDGINDYVEVPDSGDFSFTDGAGNDEPFSISIWLKHNTLASSQFLMTKFDESTTSFQEWMLLVSSSGYIGMYLNDTSGNRIGVVSSAGVISASVWHHIVVTYDGSNSETGIKLYLDDSSLSATGDSSGSYSGMSNTTIPVRIGCRQNSGSPTYVMDGIIDEVVIWKGRVLSAAEVTKLNHGGLGLSFPFIGCNGVYPAKINGVAVNTLSKIQGVDI
jgi:hypothetical protein